MVIKKAAILEKSGLVFRMTYSNNRSGSIYFGRLTKQTLAHLASKCVYWRANRAISAPSNNIRTQNYKLREGFLNIIIRNDVITQAKAYSDLFKEELLTYFFNFIISNRIL